MFWPTKLAVFYPLPEHSLPWFEVAGSVALLLAITAAVIYFHRARYLAVGWCLFVVTLIPVIGIIQVGRQSMADRYAYFPYIGLFIILAWGLNALASGTSALSRFAPPAAALCLILALSAATFRYLSYWQNSVALLTRASILADHPDISIEGALADAFLFSGQDDQAYQHYRKAIVLQRNFASGYYNMGAILLRQYRLKEALEQFELAGTYTDSKEQALSCLLASGQISYELGDYETAKLRTDSALQLDPTNNDALLLRQQLINRR
jgi:tetratricopeptide (TPR) repeat protein